MSSSPSPHDNHKQITNNMRTRGRKDSNASAASTIADDNTAGKPANKTVDDKEAVDSSGEIADKTDTRKLIWKDSNIGSKKKKKKYRMGTNNTQQKGEGNELSHIIPGYTAPMRLEAKSISGTTHTSLSELRKRASQKDSAIYTPSISILDKSNNDNLLDESSVTAKKVKTPSSIAIHKKSIRKIPTSFASSFRKGPRKQHDNTAGSGWFNMNPTPMTDQLKTDLAIIRNRNYLDPKKFYKSADSFAGKVLQVGTVIEGSSEFYSSRLAKRDRRQNLTEEIMADSTVSSYAKRKYNEIQSSRPQKRRKSAGGGKRGRGRR